MPNEIKLKNPVELAFVGDAVYELLVRDYIARKIDTGAGRLHRMAVSFVRADAQAKALESIEFMLSDEERDIVRRGKNSSKTTVPRNGNPKSYRSATALEALFGYLFLLGRSERIGQLFAAVIVEREMCEAREDAERDERG